MHWVVERGSVVPPGVAPVTVHEKAPCLKSGGSLHPARPDLWTPRKRPRATLGGLMAALRDRRVERGGFAPVLAHVHSFGQDPRGSPDFLAYSVPKAYRRHRLGTWVPRCLGVAHSACKPKAAQGLGCSLSSGLCVTFGRLTCMARAVSLSGLWTLGFLLLRGTFIGVLSSA